MDSTNCVYWLSGYFEDRDSLTASEVQRVKDMLSSVVTIPPVKPTSEQIEKMVRALFPDLSGIELEKTIEYYRNNE